jgi:hypothetical protein
MLVLSARLIFDLNCIVQLFNLAEFLGNRELSYVMRKGVIYALNGNSCFTMRWDGNLIYVHDWSARGPCSHDAGILVEKALTQPSNGHEIRNICQLTAQNRIPIIVSAQVVLHAQLSYVVVYPPVC